MNHDTFQNLPVIASEIASHMHKKLCIHSKAVSSVPMGSAESSEIMQSTKENQVVYYFLFIPLKELEIKLTQLVELEIAMCL